MKLHNQLEVGKRDSSSKSDGIGFIGVLQVAFIVLKLCKVINWPWVWVMSPIIFSVIFGFCAIVIFVLCMGLRN